MGCRGWGAPRGDEGLERWVRSVSREAGARREGSPQECGRGTGAVSRWVEAGASSLGLRLEPENRRSQRPGTL